MRCRLSRRSVTYTRGTVAPAPLPAPQPYTSAHLIAKGFERVHIGLSAALEPRPTHHLLKSSSPSARSSVRRHCASRIPPDPATLNLSRERFPFTCGRCEQNKLFDADRRAQALGDHHQRDHRPRHHRLRVPRRHLPNRSLRPRRRPPSPPATLAATALTAAAICGLRGWVCGCE